MNHESTQKHRTRRTDDGLSELQRAALARIDAALLRLESGTYGECAKCKRPIELERLEDQPETDRCEGCSNLP